ncbi:MAG: hypothetical protein LBP19_01745 [Treponema sp.]|jgi:hypothetical protein|nr:hypothetical protein [Treponema sp.]
MYILMLAGPHRCGKTSVLNDVYDELIRSGAEVIETRTQLGADPKAFKAVLRYKEKRIALCTMGDLSREVCDAMRAYAQKQADFLLIACNERLKKPFKLINNYDHRIIWKRKSHALFWERHINEAALDLVKTIAALAQSASPL